MGIVVVPSFGADPVSITGPTLDAKVDGLATEFNGSIDNDNIKSAAAIANSKLNLAAITQNIAHSGTMNHTGAVTLGAATTMSAKDFTEAKGADVASATTTTIWVTDGNYIHITGTTTITSFGTAAQAGDERTIVFDGILTLTHNATSLICPGGANITTAAGDRAIVRAETTTNARVISYTKADGTAVVTSVPSAAAQSDQETATSTTTYVTPGRQQYHPSAPKAWCVFNGGTAGTNAPTAGYNVTSVTRNSAGNYTINLTTSFSSTNYAIIGMSDTSGATKNTIHYSSSATGSFVILNWNGGASPADATVISVMAFGDQ